MGFTGVIFIITQIIVTITVTNLSRKMYLFLKVECSSYDIYILDVLHQFIIKENYVEK